ncbi:pyridoxal phosphate-dependent transferase [Daldinia caldariorum]|uniref:pyridoxal phosphate-dependent transferase n=1 Tax=Daldinia caldariorum TaxID=326644 RepID=UPI002007CB92|nr:pyridoxal phosphate-dependent transferase [Daldinia caldariorum]KAI1463653.1 pyridoxal phosphate-dependent transferase [Daldinia caldariorum]
MASDRVNQSLPVSNSQLDHDFHSGWGSVYTNRSTVSDEEILPLWLQYASDKGSVERKYQRLLYEYTDLFSDFFGGYYPISMHAHATDALLPTTIASLILNTIATSPLVLNSPELKPKSDENPEDTGKRVRDFALSFLGWDDKHVLSPNFIVADNIYGAGYGPLAHTSKEWEISAIAAGPKPIVVDMKNATEEVLNAQFADAKAKGCIAVVFDLVSTEDGLVLRPDDFGRIKACCARNRLLLIVDETMTAMRCGAPFAFQRQEYVRKEADKQPDLVIFGKGIGVSGVAIGFKGVITTGLTYTDPADIRKTIRYWRALVSRPIRLPILLEALSILRTAQAENWPANSEKIGDVIRDIIGELDPSTREPDAIRGLGAVVAVNREVAMKFRVMSAIRRRSPWARWLPKLDGSSADREVLRRQVFGVDSKANRQILAKEADQCGIIPLWCFICGIEATSKDWCRTCYLSFCDNEVCVQAFHRHACV